MPCWMAKNIKQLQEIVKERHSIYMKRQAGEDPPWTNDPIFQNYRFPNMFREFDKVTMWIANNWRIPNLDDPYVWFAMAVSRYVNLPESLEEIGYPIPWNSDNFVSVLDDRKRRGLKVFTSAYMISPGKEANKAVHLANVLTVLWKKRKQAVEHFASLEEFHTFLHSVNGIGGFMAAQIVADVKYTPLLQDAPDWYTWAYPGPGSLRGLNRLLDRPISSPWKVDDWLEHINSLRLIMTRYLAKIDGAPIPHSQDTQGFCCEYDKVMRTRLGEGRPRSKYNARG